MAAWECCAVPIAAVLSCLLPLWPLPADLLALPEGARSAELAWAGLSVPAVEGVVLFLSALPSLSLAAKLEVEEGEAEAMEGDVVHCRVRHATGGHTRQGGAVLCVAGADACRVPCTVPAAARCACCCAGPATAPRAMRCAAQRCARTCRPTLSHVMRAGTSSSQSRQATACWHGQRCASCTQPPHARSASLQGSARRLGLLWAAQTAGRAPSCTSTCARRAAPRHVPPPLAAGCVRPT